MTATETRKRLVDTLSLDLVGPEPDSGNLAEALSQSPSRWYLTGFLIPRDAGEEQKAEEESTEELAAEPTAPGIEDSAAAEPASAKKKFLPSSMGLSVLVPPGVEILKLTVRWGDYTREDAVLGVRGVIWQREHREEGVEIEIPSSRMAVKDKHVPESGGLRVAWSVRPVKVAGSTADLIPIGTRVVSVFVVNQRKPIDGPTKDQASVFQVQLIASSSRSFVARPNLQSYESEDWDERVADLQYRDAYEYAVGHAVSAEAKLCDGHCKEVQTCWIPRAEVERVAPTTMPSVTLGMDQLANLTDAGDAQAKLGPLVTEYRSWILGQGAAKADLSSRRQKTVEHLLHRAEIVANRIQRGIDRLADTHCLEAFRIANGVMAQQARQRRGAWEKKDPAKVKTEWFPFQLAFILMNLPGIADPKDADQSTVDLLFFPTGGGKTEAYLGLAAFTLALRRMRDPSIGSSGVAVLMRYTLRLLTLDQLSRAATMICAMELERKKDEAKLGKWPFEIGLWVGQAATPNKMGFKGDNDPRSARTKTQRFQRDSYRYPPPIPLRECPWCGTQFTPNSFALRPDQEHPLDLLIRCVNRDCAFTGGNYLPIQAVDEPMYRRLPCFIIATVDKFAAMPWTGPVGALFGRVDRYDQHGFYGPCAPGIGMPLPGNRLLPPALIIQDELHLISGPLGTMVGLYETALDELACIDIDQTRVRPKIIASTATVRRAEAQIQALFNRRTVDIFPPPGPDRRHSFFAEVHTAQESNARCYVGIAAQGRSPKLILLRSYLALLAAAEKAYKENPADDVNPADAYMTLLGYFNSLRELGGCRRVIEDEINNRLKGYDTRRRVGETTGIFARREVDYEPVELTSRVSTASVATAKRRLAEYHCKDDSVDVAIATNMISVGLDIVRLGLMVVFGQPKSCAEYIQATSRVGRDAQRPGLVVALLNIHKPRDRSHYERFVNYHESFYRNVEATSVTPFSPRALDRGLAGTVVALARLGYLPMTPSVGATKMLTDKSHLDFVLKVLEDRAASHQKDSTAEDEARFRQRTRAETTKLLDTWLKIAKDLDAVPTQLKYQKGEDGKAVALLHDFLDPDLKGLHPRFLKFRANRSMRDVEPEVNLWMRTFDAPDRDVDTAEEDDE